MPCPVSMTMRSNCGGPKDYARPSRTLSTVVFNKATDSCESQCAWSARRMGSCNGQVPMTWQIPRTSRLSRTLPPMQSGAFVLVCAPTDARASVREELARASLKNEACLWFAAFSFLCGPPLFQSLLQISRVSEPSDVWSATPFAARRRLRWSSVR
jgi:hypothetical protein